MESRKSLFRVDHVGSLVRPAEVLDSFDRFEDGEIGAEEFRHVQEKNIRAVVKLQEEIGLPCVTDGEFRRRIYNRGVFEAISGLEQRPGPFSFKNNFGSSVAMMCGYVSAKLEKRKRIVADDFAFLRSVARATPKATLPSPTYFHFGLFKNCVDRDAYRDVDEFHADLIRIYKEEIRDLAALGCEFVQLDEVPLAMLCDADNREIVRQQGEDPDRIIDMYIELNNEVCRARPAGMRLAMHFCRGNRTGMWAASGGYDPIAERIFNEIEVDGYLLEFDTSRSGGFSPLRHLPAGKMALLGLVSTKRPEIESKDEIRRRLDEAARYAPLERLGLCPQCGFGASAMRGAARQNPMTQEIQNKKLRLLVEVAGEVWN